MFRAPVRHARLRSSAGWRCRLLRWRAMAARDARAAGLRRSQQPAVLERSEARASRTGSSTLVAQELGATVSYTWWAQRRGFMRNTLKAGLCDLVPGHADAISKCCARPRPYYRSTYVFVTASATARASPPSTIPRLRDLRIGVQLVGDDGFNTPPAHALARRGIVGQRARLLALRRLSRSRTRRPASSRRSRRARSTSRWSGARWPATSRQRQTVPLRVTPVTPQVDGPRLPMIFDIAMGVRREDDGAAPRDRRARCATPRPRSMPILAHYGVPRLDPPTRVGAAP